MNIHNIARQISFDIPLALGMTVVLIVGGIDLSVGAILALSSAVSAGFISQGMPLPLAVVCALIIGAFLGAINGALIAYGKLAPFIVTLATQMVYRGATLVFTDGNPITKHMDGYFLAYIGQGYLLATPLQAAVYTSYFANSGQAFVPHLVKEIKTKDQIQETETQSLLTNLVDSANLQIIRQAMRQTVLTGTAQSLQSVPVAVAGKTGTAQFNRNKTPHSWFSSFAPYDDPKIVMTVIVEEGGDTGWAVTVSRQFMEWYFSQ